MTLEILFTNEPKPSFADNVLTKQQDQSIAFAEELKAIATINEGEFRASRVPRRVQSLHITVGIVGPSSTHFELLPIAAFATKAAAAAFLTAATAIIRQWLKNQGEKSIVIKTPKVTLTIKGTASIDDAMKAIQSLGDSDLLPPPPTTRAERRKSRKEATAAAKPKKTDVA